VLRIDPYMVAQSLENVTGSLVSNLGNLSPRNLSDEVRLVFKEQVFADGTPSVETCSSFSGLEDSPIETFRECENPKRPWLWANDSDSKRVLVVRPGCKLWACPACSQRNRRRWAVRVFKGVEAYECERRQWWLATITMRGGKIRRDFLRDVAIMRDGWAKLYLRMKRHTSKAGNPHLRYVLLPELAPDTERLHCHMILNDSLTAVPQDSRDNPWRSDFLKDDAAACGLGYMNDIRPIDNAKLVAWYVSKYVGKSLGVNDWPKDFRRIRTSVGWPELKPEESIGENLTWNLADSRKIGEIVVKFWSVGFDAINLNTGELIEFETLPNEDYI
jgi:hypothetical protein